ncbi:MAG: peptidoglycan-binding protein [Oscillospiraceae bacterium]|nr:peptidoglycan-binding protein [Oscillospiraceae bacterium]
MALPEYYATLRRGSTGPDVSMVQTWLSGLPRATWPCLQNLTVDGNYGSSTEQAVRFFQSGSNLNPDGVVGRQTWNALYAAYAAANGEGEQYPGTAMRSGHSGATVRSVQARLNARGAALTLDGNYGGKTVSAVQTFQRASRLTADGVVGRQTWNALYAAT